MKIVLTIKKKLEEKEMSAYRLAKETGIKMSALHQMIHNKNKSVNLEYLALIAEVLDCKPCDLLGVEKPQKK
jgi:DNA-binding Xre family transcriptional regulator